MNEKRTGSHLPVCQCTLFFFCFFYFICFNFASLWFCAEQQVHINLSKPILTHVLRTVPGSLCCSQVCASISTSPSSTCLISTCSVFSLVFFIRGPRMHIWLSCVHMDMCLFYLGNRSQDPTSVGGT